MRSKCATLGEWEGGREEATEERREEARNMCHTHRMNAAEAAAATTPKAASVSFPNGVRTVIYPEGNMQT